MDLLAYGLAWYIVFVISATFHEAAHAFAALKLGDKTAYQGGQVSLDPVPHIRREPVGMILVPFISYLANQWMLGWASVPYDPFWAQRHPKRAALMALAGPAANLTLVLVAVLVIRVGLAWDWFYPPSHDIDPVKITMEVTPGFKPLAIVVSILFTLNVVLFAFNLLPLPPLDGSSVLLGSLSKDAAGRYRQFFSQPGVSLIGLLLAWYLFRYVFDPVFLFFINLLYHGYARYGPRF